jgi:hypothetical protein
VVTVILVLLVDALPLRLHLLGGQPLCWVFSAGLVGWGCVVESPLPSAFLACFLVFLYRCLAVLVILGLPGCLTASTSS